MRSIHVLVHQEVHVFLFMNNLLTIFTNFSALFFVLDVPKEKLDDPLCIKNIEGKVLFDNDVMQILLPDKIALLENDEDEGEVDEEEDICVDNGLRGL